MGVWKNGVYRVVGGKNCKLSMYIQQASKARQAKARQSKAKQASNTESKQRREYISTSQRSIPRPASTSNIRNTKRVFYDVQMRSFLPLNLTNSQIRKRSGSGKREGEKI